MAAAETLLRAHIKSIVEDEFSAEDFTVENDKLGRSAGMDGRNRLAVSPEYATARPAHRVELVVRARLQLYLAYEAEPDENLVVDPGIIEGLAERLRTASRDNPVASTSDLWFLHLESIEYPDDPTGNKSRLEAIFEATGNNEAALF